MGGNGGEKIASLNTDRVTDSFDILPVKVIDGGGVEYSDEKEVNGHERRRDQFLMLPGFPGVE
ncbi:hypothetical protein A2618_02635 [Candidatus Collierbacteria bacterium RIFOXYD1_FULL_46_26]|uniref:Uncharacterized protein n=1 Tax=Candidatus Collierbacteria bacterium RIFOXYD1_FULL_46_26 TaxID=1817732 RepID=A0A1F5FZE2_9BACT|nr:MAG: hypothetical protein A2618_02635 [Candidatus Collierbacteria bacterium RIFOXYD1_FULL_46_26]